MTETEPAAPQQTPGPSQRSVDRSLMQGIVWTGVAKWGTQLLSWAATLIIARILTRTDYGLVGMATFYLGLVQMLNEFGLGAAILQRRDLREDQVSRLFGLSILVGIAFTLLSVAFSDVIASLFGDPAVGSVVAALSVNFFLSGIQVVPRALLARDLAFRKIAWIDVIEGLVLTGSALALALSGFSYWSLVIGNILSKTASTIALSVLRRHSLSLPFPFAPIRDAVEFGWHVLGSRLAWYWYSNADFAIVGRMLGADALGSYSIGWTLASIPVDKVSAILGRVTLPVFSAVQKDLAALRRYLFGITEALALITFPASAGLSLLADELVLVALGERWRPAIVPLRLLALYGGFRSIMTLFPQVLIAIGLSRRNMQFNLIAAVVMPVMFFIGANFGTTGVAAAWLIGYPLTAVPYFVRVTLRELHMSWPSFLRSLIPALSATAALTAAVVLSRVLLPPALPLGARFGIHVAVGALAYVSVVLLAYGRRVRAFFALVRGHADTPVPPSETAEA